MGSWGTTGLGTRPGWSDTRGKIRIERSDFIAPAGWQWDILDDEQGWEIKPELSVAFEPDEGLNEWQQDAFEQQTRRTFQNWPDQMIKSTWFDSVINSMCKWSERHLSIFTLSPSLSLHVHVFSKEMKSSPKTRLST